MPENQRPRRARRILPIAAGLLFLSGCSTPAVSPTSAQPVDVQSSTRVTASMSGAEQALIGQLGKIHPGLVAKPERAIRRARNVCDAPTRYEGDQAKIVDYVRQEFSGGTLSITTDEARAVLATIQASGVCPKTGQ